MFGALRHLRRSRPCFGGLLAHVRCSTRLSSGSTRHLPALQGHIQATATAQSTLDGPLLSRGWRRWREQCSMTWCYGYPVVRYLSTVNTRASTTIGTASRPSPGLICCVSKSEQLADVTGIRKSFIRSLQCARYLGAFKRSPSKSKSLGQTPRPSAIPFCCGSRTQERKLGQHNSMVYLGSVSTFPCLSPLPSYIHNCLIRGILKRTNSHLLVACQVWRITTPKLTGELNFSRKLLADIGTRTALAYRPPWSAVMSG